MANSDKNIVIQPSIGSTLDQPSITFTGAGNSSITLKVLDDAEGTLSFEGYEGQVFAINNNLSSGVIYSVNDISGFPIIDADASGNVRLSVYSGNVGVGTTLATAKLDVAGTIKATSFSGDGSGLSNVSSLTIAESNSSDIQKIAFVASASTTSIGITESSLVFVPSTSSLGIGTTNPQYNLHVIGTINAGIISATQLDIRSGSGTTVFSAAGIGTTTSDVIFAITDYSDNSLFSATNAGNLDLVTETGGGVGIGTSGTSTYPLNVGGTARVEGLIVGSSSTVSYYKLEVNTTSGTLDFVYYAS